MARWGSDRNLLGLELDSVLEGCAPPALTTRPVIVDRQLITRAMRGSRFIDYTTCTLCGTDREGIEYHGELLSGAKVHTLQAHSVGRRHVRHGEPRCLGSGARLVFVGGEWRGAQP